MTVVLCRGGRSSGLERHHPHDPGPWITVYGEVYKRTLERNQGRVVYEIQRKEVKNVLRSTKQLGTITPANPT